MLFDGCELGFRAVWFHVDQKTKTPSAEAEGSDGQWSMISGQSTLAGSLGLGALAFALTG